jgi:hypothetical protein
MKYRGGPKDRFTYRVVDTRHIDVINQLGTTIGALLLVEHVSDSLLEWVLGVHGKILWPARSLQEITRKLNNLNARENAQCSPDLSNR